MNPTSTARQTVRGDARDPRAARDLRAIVGDGVAFSVMVGLGETYVPAFVLAAGLGAVVAGLVATLPMLVGALFQLVTPRAVRHLRSYRRWTVLCASCQALSFLPLLLGAALGHIALPWLAVATVAYWGFGMGTSPAWNAWVTSLVPQEIRARFFARRTRLSQAALFMAILCAGLVLEWGHGRGRELPSFALLFALAMAARAVSASCLSRQSEAPELAEEHRILPLRAVLTSLRHPGSGRVLAYLLGMQAAVNVAAPFFTPYMLGPLALSYTRFMTLTAAAFMARMAVLPLLGRLAHVHGAHPLLWWGAVGIVPLPALWLVSDDFRYLLCLQVFAGTAWAALEFATMLSFFEGIPERERTSVLTAFNLANAAAIALGAAIGGRLFVSVGGASGAYAWLFLLSALSRLLVLPILRGTVSPRVAFPMRLRTLAVRPSAGAVQRPILASVEEPETPETPETPPAPPSTAPPAQVTPVRTGEG